MRMSKSNSGKPKQPATVYHLCAENDGQTLSAALKAVVADASWKQVKKWIAKRQVQINGNLCLDEARRVTEKDVIKLWEQPLASPARARDIRIVYLDANLLVVEKPSGVTSVRHFAERKISTRRRQLQPTLEELLPPALAKAQKLRWPPLPPVGMNKGRRETNLKRGKKQPNLLQNAKKLPPELQVFPVHRLDRDTSGLMLFARNRIAEQKLIGLFRRQAVSREYVAVCHGLIENQTIKSMLVRDRGDGVRGSLPEDADAESSQAAQQAITHIISSEPIETASNSNHYSLIRLKLETGRTHQIRIHLSEAGHPICGDKIYFKRADGTLTKDGSQPPRQVLHSDRLAFTHPITGESLSFDMPLPQDLARWLKALKTQGS